MSRTNELIKKLSTLNTATHIRRNPRPKKDWYDVSSKEYQIRDERNRQYYLRNQERIRKQAADRYQQNKDQRLKEQKKYRESNREAENERSRAYNEKVRDQKAKERRPKRIIQ